MARAIMSAATPAVTPAMEMTVTTPTTACRRLALRYRAATYNSNRIPIQLPIACAGLEAGTKAAQETGATSHCACAGKIVFATPTLS